MSADSTLDRLDAVLRKIMSVPREEILKRDKAWKRKRTALKKKKAKGLK